MRLLNEPLVGHIPILFVCARGPGLKDWTEPKPRRFAPYLRLWLAGNPLSEESKTKHLAALKNAGVRLQD